MFDNNKSMRLLISTDIKLSAIDIIQRYAKRWDIESMFNELKNRFRFKDIMMHNKKSYYQFLYFKVWCFIIIKLISLQYKNKIIDYVREMLPWRVVSKNKVKITAGVTKLALKTIFTTLDISMFFPKVSKNIETTNSMKFEEDYVYDLTG